MSDLLDDALDETNDPYTRGAAAAGFAFCVLFLWEALCAMISVIINLGPLTFGKAMLCVNGFCLGLAAIALGVGAWVTISAKKKEEEDDPSEQ